MKRLILITVCVLAAWTAGAQSYKTVTDIPYSQADAYPHLAEAKREDRTRKPHEQPG